MTRCPICRIAAERAMRTDLVEEARRLQEVGDHEGVLALLVESETQAERMAQLLFGAD